MPLTPYEKVSVYYPRGLATGGPEALHQLVDALRTLGCDGYLTPMPGTEHLDRVARYQKYDAPEVGSVIDEPGCAVVWPESYGRWPPDVKHADGCQWWLSVDNSPLFASRRPRVPDSKRGPRDWARQARAALERPPILKALRSVDHIAQSMYAWSTVFSSLGHLPSLVSDYTNAPVLDRVPQAGRRPTVAFNVAKGGERVRQVRQLLGDRVRWAPIATMSRDEVRRILENAEIYLDLGHHPGKDRLPREAAAAGAVTIVLRAGAGAFSADVGIPPDHKISPQADLIGETARTIEWISSDLALHHSRQAPYRAQVAREREVFFGEVRGFFLQHLRGLDGPPQSNLQAPCRE